MAPAAKIVVLGTGDLAIPVLEAVTSEHSVARIVSRPHRRDEDSVLPEERRAAALPKWAREHDIAIRREAQPSGDRLRRQLEELSPELGLVVAYGRRFPTSLLGVPKRGWWKVHFSLLPKNRGLNPIRSALWFGEAKTGVSVIRVTEEPDAGPILSQESLEIGADESFGDLAPRVAALAAEIVGPAISRVLRSKNPTTRPQNEKAASHTPRFDQRHRRAPWWRTADVVSRRLRALSPEPGLRTLIKRQRVRIVAGAPANYLDATPGESGSFIGLRSGQMAVLCGEGTIFGIRRAQLESGETVSASRLVRETGLRAGDVIV